MSYKSPDFGNQTNPDDEFVAGWIVPAAIAVVIGLAVLAYSMVP